MARCARVRGAPCAVRGGTFFGPRTAHCARRTAHRHRRGDREGAEMILILTEADDPHADRVIEILRGRGTEWVRFNPARFPSGAEISFSCTAAGEVRSLLRTGEETVALDRVTAVWYRRPELP